MRRYSLFGIVFLCVLFVASGYAQDESERPRDREEALQEIQKAIDQKGAHWTAGMTDVFKLPLEQRRRMCGLRDPLSLNRIPDAEQVMRYPWHPDKFDWTKMDGADWMSPVRNQKACGSCAAFATIGTLEGQVNIYHTDPSLDMDLSEQHIFSCGGGTCEEGWSISEGFRYLLEQGAPDEDCFPYTSGDRGVDRLCEETCPDWRDRAITISCWGWVGGDYELRTPAEIKEQILKGPVATGMNVHEDFEAYSGGIYEHVSGEFLGGHGVVFVGWDDTTTPPCWIVRNSWGMWGERGYFRIRMGTNEVGIEERSLYLTLGDVPEGELSDNGHLFGNVEIGDSEDWQLLIYNHGAADLEVYGFNSDLPDYSVSAPTSFPQTVAPGGTLDVTVTFAPDSVGFRYGHMIVRNNSCAALPELKLRGTGVVHTVKASPKSIELTMAQGEVKSVPITVTYTGDTTITFEVEVLREWLSVEPEGGTMEPGDSVSLEVTFDASSLSPGEVRTNILIKTDDPTDKIVVVPVLLQIEAAGITVSIPTAVTPIIDPTVELAITLDNGTQLESPITEVAVSVSFDPALLELETLLPTPRTDFMSSFLWSESEPGELTLSISDTTGKTISPGTGAVAEMAFAILSEPDCGDSCWLVMTDVTLVDTSGTTIDVGVRDGTIIFLCKADVDADGTVDVIDVLQAVNFILEKTCIDAWSPQCWAADCNDDRKIDVMDIVGMVNLILGRGGCSH